LVDQIAARIRTELANAPGFAALQRCTPIDSRACTDQLSAALYDVLGRDVEPAIDRGESDLLQRHRAQSAAIVASALQPLAQARDPIDRVAALVLLERASLEPAQLPLEAFAELDQKPVVEAQLLLAYSQHLGLPEGDALEQVAALAAGADVDARVQGAALAALARGESADELNEAVRTLGEQHPASWSGWSDMVAPALARCGIACIERTAQIVAEAADPGALAIQILRRTDAAQRAFMLDELVPSLSDDALVQVSASADL
jgi:hypothetical protein